jgi:hypothetical protein
VLGGEGSLRANMKHTCYYVSTQPAVGIPYTTQHDTTRHDTTRHDTTRQLHLPHSMRTYIAWHERDDRVGLRLRLRLEGAEAGVGLGHALDQELRPPGGWGMW